MPMPTYEWTITGARRSNDLEETPNNNDTYAEYGGTTGSVHQEWRNTANNEDQLAAGWHHELAQYPMNVILDGVLRHSQLLCDLTIDEALSKHPTYLTLLGSQAVPLVTQACVHFHS
jgi:hypothetical protein